MTKLLILESATADLIHKAHQNGLKSGSECFVDCFRTFDVHLEFLTKKPYEGEFDPALLHDVDGVVLTGSSVNWSVDDERARPLQNAVHATLNSGLPIWGSCNGMQMVAFILGGEIGASPHGFELGLAKELTLTHQGRAHSMMKNRTNPFFAPCVHRDEVQKLPDGAQLLAQNAHSPIQAFAYEEKGVRFWGAQYHPEFTAHDVSLILNTSQGIFSDQNNDAQWLAEAEGNEEAATHLGTTSKALQTPIRALELRNWLDHFFGAAL